MIRLMSRAALAKMRQLSSLLHVEEVIVKADIAIFVIHFHTPGKGIRGHRDALPVTGNPQAQVRVGKAIVLRCCEQYVSSGDRPFISIHYKPVGKVIVQISSV